RRSAVARAIPGTRSRAHRISIDGRRRSDRPYASQAPRDHRKRPHRVRLSRSASAHLAAELIVQLAFLVPFTIRSIRRFHYAVAPPLVKKLSMLVGPVFTREFVAAPRRVRFYLAPAVYVAMLLMLSATAWMLLTGTQHVRNIGDVARFGGAL